MANSASLSYTCGCSFAHVSTGSVKAQDNIEYKMCQTHSVKTNPNRWAIQDAAVVVLNALNTFRVLSGN